MPAYYNEIDPKKAAWLRELIARNLIAPGDVDERSIADVRADDLRGYRQCHFLAGIGIWSYALRLAGWPDDREVWTGSCPCQPFSAAGKGEAFDDERHLWPVWFPLIEARRPIVCFGEQVASIDGLAWLDLVQTDLDGADYTCGAVDLCAAGVGAPHWRQRLYWVADSACSTSWAGFRNREQGGIAGDEPGNNGDSGGMDDSASARCNGPIIGTERDLRNETRLRGSGDRGEIERVGVSDCEQLRTVGLGSDTQAGEAQNGNRQRERVWVDIGKPGPVNGFWRSADWVLTRPQRVGDRPGLRPIERGSFPLAHGASERVGRLRGYGDGIVAQAAQAFIEAYLGTKDRETQ